MRSASLLVAGLFTLTFCRGSAFAQGGNTAPASAPTAGAGSFSNTPTLDRLNSLLIFPATNQAGEDFNDAASKLGVEVKLKIDGIGRYHALGYAPTLPAIDRAYTVEESLTSADLTPPFNTPAKGKRIAQVVGTDGYILMSLDEASVDTAERTVSLTSTAQVYSVSSDDPVITLTVTGKAVSAGSADPLQDVEQRAVDNAASKIVQAISPGFGSNTSQTAIPKSGGSRKLGGSKFLAIVLLGIIAGVIIAASHSNSSSSSNSGSNNSGTSGGSGSSGPGGPPAPPAL